MKQSQEQNQTCGNCSLSEIALPQTSMNGVKDPIEATCSISKRPHNMEDECDIDRWESKGEQKQ